MTTSPPDPNRSGGSGSGGFVDDVQQGLGSASEVLDGAEKKQYQLPDANPEFHNGEDLNLPSGAEDSTQAPGGGSLTRSLADTIELVHFGKVWRDKSTFFAHQEERDDVSKLNATEGAHAIMHRAALERECILLAGFIGSLMAALEDEGQSKGALGTVMQVAADLLGGSAGTNQLLTAADLNPLITKAKEIGAKLDTTAIAYPTLHQAGCDLHELRAKYGALLKEQGDKAKDKYKSDQGGLLSTLPGLGSLMGGPIGGLLTVLQSLSFKAFDVYQGMLLQLAANMQPAIEQACCAISIESIRKRHVPVFGVWFEPPPPPDDDTLIHAPGSTGLAPLDSAVGGAVDAFNDNVGTHVLDVIDFLSRPSKATPGGPFVEMAFILPPSPLDPAAQRSATLLPPEQRLKRPDKLAEITEAAFAVPLGMDHLPGFLSDLVKEVSKVTISFLRAIYGKLVTLDPTVPLVKDELIEAARLHLVDEVIEKIFQSLGFLEELRAFGFDLQGKHLSGEALIARGKELIAEKINPAVDPVVCYAVGHLADELEAVRAVAAAGGASAGAVTMEAYLAVLPSVTGKLFRNTFFPVWDLLKDTVFGAITDALTPGLDKIGGVASEVKGVVDGVRDKIVKAQKLYDAATTTGLKAGLGGLDTKPYEDALASGLPPEEQGLGPAVKERFPFTARRPKATATEPTADEIEQTKDKLKWQEPGQDAAPADPASPPAQP